MSHRVICISISFTEQHSAYTYPLYPNKEVIRNVSLSSLSARVWNRVPDFGTFLELCRRKFQILELLPQNQGVARLKSQKVASSRNFERAIQRKPKPHAIYTGARTSRPCAVPEQGHQREIFQRKFEEKPREYFALF